MYVTYSLGPLMTNPNKPCACYYGEACTRTTVCCLEAAVEEVEEELQDALKRIEELEDERKRLINVKIAAQVFLLAHDDGIDATSELEQLDVELAAVGN